MGTGDGPLRPGAVDGQWGAQTFGERFATSPNALHFVRLCLALEVVFWHSYALRGGDWLPLPVVRLLADIAVDGFFAISGFLVVGAWCRRPNVATYLQARARRIFPGLWACLLVTGFVIAPLSASFSGGESPAVQARWQYVVANASTFVNAWGIEGGPHGVPHAGTWNGSLWSLSIELICYLVVAAMGAVFLLRRRLAIAIASALWLSATVFAVSGVELQVGHGTSYFVLRCGLMFSFGAAAWFLKENLGLQPQVATVAIALIVAGTFFPDYRVVAAPGITYLCLYLGLALGRYPRLVLRHDLSYGTYLYGFPVQQALLISGLTLAWIPFAALSIVCVLPLAAASWFLVERPCLGRRSSVRAVDRKPGGVETLTTPAASTAQSPGF